MSHDGESVQEKFADEAEILPSLLSEDFHDLKIGMSAVMVGLAKSKNTCLRGMLSCRGLLLHPSSADEALP